jgi:hypothetical protein
MMINIEIKIISYWLVTVIALVALILNEINLQAFLFVGKK